MTTITAVELRNNFASIVRRVKAGEEIVITYRDEPALRLSSAAPKKTGMPGLEALLEAPRKISNLDPNKSFKELYHEELDKRFEPGGKYDY